MCGLSTVQRLLGHGGKRYLDQPNHRGASSKSQDKVSHDFMDRLSVLSEVAAPAPIENEHEAPTYLHRTLEDNLAAATESIAREHSPRVALESIAREQLTNYVDQQSCELLVHLGHDAMATSSARAVPPRHVAAP